MGARTIQTRVEISLFPVLAAIAFALAALSSEPFQLVIFLVLGGAWGGYALGLFVQARRTKTLPVAHLVPDEVKSIPATETTFEPPPRRRAFQEVRVSK